MSAASRYGAAVRGGSALLSARIASDSAPKAEDGAVSPGAANHDPHHRLAIRFHRDSAAPRALIAANIRSLSRTWSSVSFGSISSEKRTGNVARTASATAWLANSGSSAGDAA